GVLTMGFPVRLKALGRCPSVMTNTKFGLRRESELGTWDSPPCARAKPPAALALFLRNSRRERSVTVELPSLIPLSMPRYSGLTKSRRGKSGESGTREPNGDQTSRSKFRSTASPGAVTRIRHHLLRDPAADR